MRTANDRRPRGSTVLGAAGLVAVLIAGGTLLPGSVPRDELSNAVGASASSVDSTITHVPRPTHTPTYPSVGAAGEQQTQAPGTVTTTEPVTTPPNTSVPATASHPDASARHEMPAIAPSAALSLSIPSIDVDAPVLPVDSRPTGQTNAWGGPIYERIDFPVDDAVRQWVRRGDPNSLSAAQSAGHVQAFDRVVLYGHASDIGNHLVFQNLSALKPGARIVVTTTKGRFTYRATMVTSSQKADLDQFAPLYDYPQHGQKEIALVACLPDTSLNTVVIGVLVTAERR